MTYLEDTIKPINRHGIDLTGQIFTRLTVLQLATSGKSQYKRWLCRCVCGNLTEVQGSNLRSKATMSCGCLKREIVGNRSRTHGQANTKGQSTSEYKSWDAAKRRCNNPANKDYARYGGRGVEFRFDSFEDFFEHIGRKPSKEFSLDRIDNSGHYEKGNVRWATRQDQSNNVRTNVRLTFRSRAQTIAEWSRELGIKCSTLRTRLRRGWGVERALTEPIRV